MFSAEPFKSVIVFISALLASATCRVCVFFLVFELSKAKNKNDETMSLKLWDAVEGLSKMFWIVKIK